MRNSDEFLAAELQATIAAMVRRGASPPAVALCAPNWRADRGAACRFRRGQSGMSTKLKVIEPARPAQIVIAPRLLADIETASRAAGRSRKDVERLLTYSDGSPGHVTAIAVR